MIDGQNAPAAGASRRDGADSPYLGSGHGQGSADAGQKSRSRYWAGLWVTLATVSIGSLAFGPSIAAHYGRLDDFAWAFDNADGGTPTHIQAWVDSGRLLPAALAAALGDVPNSVADLALTRGIATLMLCLSAALVGLLVLRLHRASPPSAVIIAGAVALFVLSLPSIPAISTWAVLAGSSAAFPLALAGGWLATASDTRLLPWWLWSSALVLMAAFTYQHVAPIAVLPVLMWEASRWTHGESPRVSRIVVVTGSVVVSLVANAVYLRAVGSSSLSRVEGYSLTERAHWFITEYLPRTVDLAVPWSHQSALFSAILLVVFLAAPLAFGLRYLMLSAGVIAAWLFTAAVVLPTELWASYRLISAAQVVLWGGSAVVMGTCLLAIGKHSIGSMAVGFVALGAVGAVGLNGARAYLYFAEPNVSDWSAAICAVQNHPEETHLRLNTYDASTSPLLSYDEYGFVGSSVDWVLPYMIALAEHESTLGRGVTESAIEDFTVVPATPGVPGFVSVDACSR